MSRSTSGPIAPDRSAVGTPALEARGLSKRFGSGPLAVTAVDGCSLAIDAGEVVALSGPSGSGKSTLLAMLLGWIEPDAGTIELRPVPVPVPMTVVPQDLGLFDELTAGENVTVARRFHPVGEGMDAVITELGLDDLLDRHPTELSLGEQQRVAVARAIGTDAAIVIADEPTSHQDEDNATRVLAALRGAADRGAAVLLTTHDPRVVAGCDRLLEIGDGRLLDHRALDTAVDTVVTGDAATVTPAPRRWSIPRVAVVAVGALALAGALAAVALALLASTGTGDEEPPTGPAPSAEQAGGEAVVGPGESRNEPVAQLVPVPDVIEISVTSAALGRSQRALVVLPPGYEETDRRYPVLYLLHGQEDGPDQFRRLGWFSRATELMRRGEIQPMILVAPDIDNSFGVDNPTSEPVDVPDGPTIRYDGGRYETFLADDLVADIDARYRTEPVREARFVGGISMGGFAALHLGFRHPDVFNRVGGHSPALVGPEFTWLYPDRSTIERRDPLRLATTADLTGTDVFLDVGEDDGFRDPTSALGRALDRTQSTSVSTWPGGHTDTYWRHHVDTYLRFYGR